MEKGLAIIEATDTGTRGFFIDQEQVEFARQNAYTKKHREARAKAEKEARRNRRRAEKAEARRKEYTVRTFCDVSIRFAISVAVTWAAWAGMVHPIISIPVGLFCLATACLRLGVWLGKRVK